MSNETSNPAATEVELQAAPEPALKALPHTAIEIHVGAGVFLSRHAAESLREWEQYLITTEGRTVSVGDTLSRLLVTFRVPAAAPEVSA